MEHIREFFRGKGFWLVLAGSVAAAALTGVWAVDAVRTRLQQDLRDSGLQQQNEAALPQEQWEAEQWQDGMDVAGQMAGVPQQKHSDGQPGSNSSSGAASGSALPREPAALQAASEPAAAAAASSCTQPVAGAVQKAFSADELVYNETLGDWRTHNGADYACEQGDSVFAPVSGVVEQTEADGNWGGVVAIRDEAGRLWRLCGVADAAVSPGQAVVTGQRLGAVGVIGCESMQPAHLHLEVLQGEEYLDPQSLIG